MSNITINAEGKYYSHNYTIINDDTKKEVIYDDKLISSKDDIELTL